MKVLEQKVEKPTVAPDCTAEQILSGPPIDPCDRVKLYSDKKFEEFIEEWAYFYLKDLCGEYIRVARLGGAGDKGRDVIGYIDESSNPPICDIYQCKHYEKPISPSAFLPELAKLCYYIYQNSIPAPRRYILVAPRDIGSSLVDLLDDPISLRGALVEKWLDTSKATSISKSITKKEEILLEGDLETFVSGFDFGVVRHKPILEVIDEHRKTTRYAPRFGGGLTKPLPPTLPPPSEISATETRYVDQLISVYVADSGDSKMDIATVLAQATGDNYSRHFKRSRERFYYAETLREFAKDNLPEECSFSDVQDDVYDGVIDTVESEFTKKLDLVRATTDMAAKVNVGSHPLKPYVKGQSLRGICHQLVNDERFSWVESEEGAQDGE